MALPDGRNARQVRTHDGDGPIVPVPVHPALRLPAEHPGDDSEPVDGRVPLLEGNVGERALPVDAAGKVEEEVDAGKAVEELLDRRRVPEIHGGNRRHPLAPRGVDPEGEPLQFLREIPGQDDVGSRAGKRDRRGLDQGSVPDQGIVHGNQCDLPHEVRVPRKGCMRGEDPGWLFVGDPSHREPLAADGTPERHVPDLEGHAGEIPRLNELPHHRPVESVPLQGLGGDLPPDAGARHRAFVEHAGAHLDALGRHGGGVERQDRDVPVGERPCEVVPERQFGGLRGSVGKPAGVGVQHVAVDALAVEGPHHDDHTAPRLVLHPARGFQAGEPGSGEVDVHGVPVLVEVFLPVYRAELHRPGNSCVVVEDVDPVELALDLLEHLPHVLGVAHVPLDGHRLVGQPEEPDQVVHVGPGLFEGVRPPTRDDDVRPPPGGLERQGPAHPGPPSRDDDDLTGERRVRVADVVVRVGPCHDPSDQVAGGRGVRFLPEGKEEAIQGVHAAAGLVKSRHLFTGLRGEGLEEPISFERTFHCYGKLLVDLEFFIREDAVADKPACQDRGDPFGVLGGRNAGEERFDERLFEVPVNPVVAVDELRGGSLEVGDDVDGPGGAPFPQGIHSRFGTVSGRDGLPLRAHRARSRVQEGRERSRLAAGPRLDLDAAVLQPEAFVGRLGVQGDGADRLLDEGRDFFPHTLRRIGVQDKPAQNLQGPAGIPLVEGFPPLGGPLARDLFAGSRKDRLEIFPIIDPHRAGEGNGIGDPALVGAECGRKLLHPELVRFVRGAQDAVEVGEVAVPAGFLRDEPVEIAQVVSGRTGRGGVVDGLAEDRNQVRHAEDPLHDRVQDRLQEKVGLRAGPGKKRLRDEDAGGGVPSLQETLFPQPQKLFPLPDEEDFVCRPGALPGEAGPLVEVHDGDPDLPFPEDPGQPVAHLGGSSGKEGFDGLGNLAVTKDGEQFLHRRGGEIRDLPLGVFFRDQGGDPADFLESERPVPGGLLGDRLFRRRAGNPREREKREKRGLPGILLEEAAHPFLPGGRGGHLAECAGVVCKTRLETVFVPVPHRLERRLSRGHARPAKIPRTGGVGGGGGEEFLHIRPADEIGERFLLFLPGSVPVPPPEGSFSREGLLRQLDGPVQRGRGRAELVREPYVDRGVPVDRLAVHTHLRRLPGAHQAGESLHSPVTGDDAELDLGLPEAGVLRHDPVMGAHRQLVAAAEREAVHHRDDGDRQVLELRENRDVPCGKPGDLFAVFPEELVDVGPRHESPPRAGNDQRADRSPLHGVKLPDFPDDRGELGKHLLAEGVQGVGAGDRQDGHLP